MDNKRYSFEEIQQFHNDLKKRVEKESTYPTFKENLTLDPLEWNELGLMFILHKITNIDFIIKLGEVMKEHDGFNITIKVRKKE